MPPDRQLGTRRSTSPEATRVRARLPDVLRSERPFVIALGVGVVVRVLVQVAFPPAFVYSDGPTYLGFVDAVEPSPDRPFGYGALLWFLSWLTRGVDAVAITQHVLGLLTAVIIYALMRRWGVSPPLAMLATLPLLLDEMQLVLEHSVLSDVLFDFVLVLGIAALAWWRPPPAWATAAAGVLFGTAALIRITGGAAVIAGVVFCVAAASTPRARIVHGLVFVGAFVAPLSGYAAWYHHDHGVWAITQADGRALYMRTTAFVDCSTLSLPSYERTLCPDDSLGHRQDPTHYGWHDPGTVHDLHTPPGISDNAAMHDFGMRAIRGQPVDYARIVVRDFAMAFAPERVDMFEYDTAYKWSFHQYVDYEPTPDWTAPAYAAHGGRMPTSLHPVVDVFDVYGGVVYLPGPVLLVLLIVAVAGLVRGRPNDAPTTRPLTFLTVALAIGLILVPDLTAEFTWRYQLPAVVLLPVSAALGWTRLLGGRQPGTTATPSTD